MKCSLWLPSLRRDNRQDEMELGLSRSTISIAMGAKEHRCLRRRSSQSHPFWGKVNPHPVPFVGPCRGLKVPEGQA